MVLYYSCNQCNFRRRLSYVYRGYILDGERSVKMEQRHAWCAICNDISPIECIERGAEELDCLKRTLSELRSFRDNPLDVSMLGKYQRSRVENAAATIIAIEKSETDWLDWRKARQSGPKCLRCGTGFELVPVSEAESLPHGGCGGMLECTFTVHSFNGPAIYAHIYDIEGRLVEQGRQPVPATSGFGWDYEPMPLFQTGDWPEGRGDDPPTNLE